MSFRRFAFLSSVLSVGMIFGSSLLAADKLPVPEDAEIDKATQEIREVYRAEYVKATRVDAKQALAQKLLQLALETKGDPSTRYAALRIARDIAASIGDVILTRQLCDRLTSEYSFDGLAMQLEMLAKLDGNVLAQQQTNQAEFGESLARQFARAERFSEAAQALGKASIAARKAKATSLTKRLSDYQASVAEMEPLEADLPALRAKLMKSVADADANLALGRYQCFYREEWSKGTPLLALGGDSEYAKLAEADLRGEAKGAELVALADRWLKQGDKESPAAQASIQRHALRLLARAKTSLAGLESQKLQQRTESLVEALPASIAPVKVDTLHLFRGHHAAAFSPNGQFLVTADDKLVLHLWHVDTLAEVRQYTGHTAKIHVIAFFDDGKRFASLGDDQKLRIWDLHGGEFRAIEAPDGGAHLLLSSDGKRALRARDAFYIGQDLASGRQLFRHDLKFGENIGVQGFSADGRFAILSGITHTVRIGDMQGKQVVFDGQSHTYGAALSDDGSFALTCGGNDARLWQITPTTPKLLKVYQGHTQHVYGVAFSADGRRGYSTGADASLRIWDLISGEAIQVYPSALGPARDIRPSPDGRYATLVHNNVVRLVGLAD